MVSRATFAYRVTRVDEEAAANAVYAIGVILHLDHRTIPESFPVSNHNDLHVDLCPQSNIYGQINFCRECHSYVHTLRYEYNIDHEVFPIYYLIEIVRTKFMLACWV